MEVAESQDGTTALQPGQQGETYIVGWEREKGKERKVKDMNGKSTGKEMSIKNIKTFNFAITTKNVN